MAGINQERETMHKIARELSRTHAFILAGGKGERLHPLTAIRPKPAVSFGGKFRIIDFTLSNCLHSDISRVTVLTQYRYEQIHSYVNEAWCDIWKQTAGDYPVCSPPGNGTPYRGTADAVLQNLELLDLDSDYVLVLSADHIYQMDYRDLLRQHVETNADLTIATVEHPLADASAFGVVQVNEALKVTGFKEKPATPDPCPFNSSMAMVNMGIYVFKKPVLLAALRWICGSELGFDFGHDVIPKLIHFGRTYAYDFRDTARNVPKYWRDIGTIDAYYAASMDLVQADAPFDPYTDRYWPASSTPHSSLLCRVSTRKNLGCLHGSARIERSVLSRDVRVDPNAVVEESILMPGVHVGNGAEVRHAIVDEGVKIPAGFRQGLRSRKDQNQFVLTESGILVISNTRTPPVLHFQTKAAQERNIHADVVDREGQANLQSSSF
jgi:glucose-1-phosphate adenylyltransferase